MKFVDIAVDGNNLMLIIALSDSNGSIRLGFDSPFGRKSLLRVHMPNNWPQHRLFCIIHCLPRLEQRSLCVSRHPLFYCSFLMYFTITSERWGLPLLTLSAYLKFWTVICYCVTLWLLFVKKEVCIFYGFPLSASNTLCTG